MRRDASVDSIRWFTGDPCYVFHHVNAYTVHEGGHHRHAFYAAHHGIVSEGDSFNAVVHADMVSGTRREYVPGPGKFVMEPVFVERGAEAPEGDGWLLTIVYDTERNLSDFVILDTEDISAGPIARVELPTRVPYGFHGGWRGDK